MSKAANLPSLLLVVAVAALAVIYKPTHLSGDGFASTTTDIVGLAEIDGLAFPSMISTQGPKQTLIGGGTRRKWNVKVYAVGFFAERKTIKALQRKHSEGNIESRFAQDFAEHRSTKSLLLRFHRGVSSEDVSDALGEALVPSVGEVKAKEFQDFLLSMLNDRVEKGSDIYITCRGDKVFVSTNGKDSSAISMKGLSSAIFNIYLGSKPVSPPVKEGFEKAFAELIET